MEQRPVKKGRVVRNQRGKLLLENEDGVVFDVSPLVLVIWDLCDGKNEKVDICRTISQKAGVGPEEIEPLVDEVLVALEKVKLVGFG